MLEWHLEDVLIIQSDRVGRKFLAKGEGWAKAEGCVRLWGIRGCGCFHQAWHHRDHIGIIGIFHKLL